MSPTATAVPNTRPRGARALLARPAPKRAPSPARARPRHLKTVGASTRRVPHVRSRRRLILGCALTVAALLTIVAFQAVLASGQLTLDQMERRIRTAEERYQRARLRYDVAASPARIEARAQELGLVAPDHPPVPLAASTNPDAVDASSGFSSAAPSMLFGRWKDVKPSLGAEP